MQLTVLREALDKSAEYHDETSKKNAPSSSEFVVYNWD